jgi:hypothetical protein
MQEARNFSPQPRTLEEELGTILTALESALAEAGRAVVAMRSLLPQISALSDTMGELEAVMNRARRQTGGFPSAAAPPPPPPPATPIVPSMLSAVPRQEAPAEAVEERAPYEEPEQEAPEEEEEQEQHEEAPSHCLRLDVRSTVGSLELKAVDSAVNENPSVVDVALLEYDGRGATLRIWIDSSADPTSVRDALLQSLDRNLAGTEDTEVQLEFEQEPAA